MAPRSAGRRVRRPAPARVRLHRRLPPLADPAGRPGRRLGPCDVTQAAPITLGEGEVAAATVWRRHRHRPDPITAGSGNKNWPCRRPRGQAGQPAYARPDDRAGVSEVAPFCGPAARRQGGTLPRRPQARPASRSGTGPSAARRECAVP